MNQDLGKTGSTTSTDFTPDTLAKVDDTRPDDEPPAEVADTVTGVVEGETGLKIRFHGVTDEATSSVRVDADHEEECEVVSVPEDLESLLADGVVGRGVHENHDQEHEVTSDASRLGVVNHLGGLLANLCFWRKHGARMLNRRTYGFARR